MADEKSIVEVGKSTPTLSKGQKYQVELLNELDKSLAEMGTKFTDYGKTCVINAIASLLLYCQNNEIKLESINPIVLKAQLQNVGFSQLNMSALPSEAYFDMRKTWVEIVNKTTGEKESKLLYNVAIKPQGAGNEKLLRTFGVGVKKNGLHSPLLVREGETFTMPVYDGISVKPFHYEPKIECMNNKVILVCYVLEKADGGVEYLIANRESIKPNIIAQIRQNAMYKFKTTKVAKNGKDYEAVDTEARDNFYATLNVEAEKSTADELIDKYGEYVNPTYTSGGSRESMIIRKMKNNALKNYPKEYDTSYVKNAVENMFEDVDETVIQKPNFKGEVDVCEKVNKELEMIASDETAPADFELESVPAKPTPQEEIKKAIEESIKEDDGLPY